MPRRFSFLTGTLLISTIQYNTVQCNNRKRTSQGFVITCYTKTLKFTHESYYYHYHFYFECHVQGSVGFKCVLKTLFSVILAAVVITMGTKVVVCCSVLYILVDSIITTVLYTHGSQPSLFLDDALHFNILRSVLDLWGTVLLRASLLLGASIGVSWNKEEGPLRVAKLTTFILFLCMVVITYALAKMLMLTEMEPLSHQPWFLSLIGWTCASSLCVMLLWRQLGKKSSLVGSHSIHSSSRSGGGGGSEDTEKLMETAGEEDEKEEEGQKKGKGTKSGSGATLGRLLSYCKKDAGLLSVAVFFLLISALCEYLKTTKARGRNQEQMHQLIIESLENLCGNMTC